MEPLWWANGRAGLRQAMSFEGQCVWENRRLFLCFGWCGVKALHVLQAGGLSPRYYRHGPLLYPTWMCGKGGQLAGRPSTAAYRKVLQGFDMDGPEVRVAMRPCTGS